MDFCVFVFNKMPRVDSEQMMYDKVCWYQHIWLYAHKNRRSFFAQYQTQKQTILASHQIPSLTPELAVKAILEKTPISSLFLSSFQLNLVPEPLLLFFWCWAIFFFLFCHPPPPTCLVSHLLPSCCSTDSEVPHHCCKDIFGVVF